jgi:hypothetical protein
MQGAHKKTVRRRVRKSLMTLAQDVPRRWTRPSGTAKGVGKWVVSQV